MRLLISTILILTFAFIPQGARAGTHTCTDHLNNFSVCTEVDPERDEDGNMLPSERERLCHCYYPLALTLEEDGVCANDPNTISTLTLKHIHEPLCRPQSYLECDPPIPCH